MTANTVHYFGYGSLVNRATRPPGERAWPARLHGWRRSWSHRVPASAERHGCTALSVDPGPAGPDGAAPVGGCTGGVREGIDGVVVAIPEAALAALDAREANYDRLALPAAAFSLPGSVRADTVFVYRSRIGRRAAADAAHPVLQSYVDCVMAGYLERFGEAGLAAWLATTDGWHGPLHDDRARPRYPRALTLSPALLARLDERLARHRRTPVQR